MDEVDENTGEEWIEQLSSHDQEVARSFLYAHGEACMRRIFEAMPGKKKGRSRQDVPLRWLAIAYERYLVEGHSFENSAYFTAQEMHSSLSMNETIKTTRRKILRQLKEIASYTLDSYVELIFSVLVYGKHLRQYGAQTIIGVGRYDIEEIERNKHSEWSKYQEYKKNFIKFLSENGTDIYTHLFTENELAQLFAAFRHLLVRTQMNKFLNFDPLRAQWEGHVFPPYFGELLPFL